MPRQERAKPVGCRGCGYGYENGRPVVKKTTVNRSGYCDECTERGVPESRAAFHALNQKAAARRHSTPTTK